MGGDGRKIPASKENPIDNVFIEVASALNRNLLSKLGIHPHWVTAASLVTGLASSYFLYQSWFIGSGALFLLSYFLDCADGNLARMRRMETTLGDWFDHVSDIVKSTTLFVVYTFVNTTIKPIMRYIFGIGTCLLGILALLHVSCQEKHSSARIISPFMTLVNCPRYIPIELTRYFGLGTLVLFQACMIFAAGYM
jgi:phosphatidylglycerophosphate synthase